MNRVAQYRNVQVMTTDRVGLIIMLYEGVLRFNKLAQKAIGEGDIKERGISLNRSLEIIGELSNSLNTEEGGEVAANLARLYEFCATSLMEANMRNDSARIEAVNRVMAELKGGWEAVATAERTRQEEPARSISCGA